MCIRDSSNLTFYLELDTEVVSNTVDARAFLDPTFDNGTAFPVKEFLANVPTREQVRWTLVTPVSTSGFQVSSSPTSKRVPLAIITTNALGQITTTVNQGLVLETYSTTLATDLPNGATTLRVTDVGAINNGSQVTVYGAATSVHTVTAVNSFENSVTITPSLAVARSTGAEVEVTSGTTRYIKLRKVANFELTTPSTHPDKQRRVFGGDESRGLSLTKDTWVATDRSDFPVNNLSDYVDQTAFNLKEAKVGFNEDLKLTNLSTTRYYDYVGSISGAKEATISIGDGVSSFGDINGNTDAVFTRAIAMAVAQSVSKLRLYVKKGLYTFGATMGVVVPASISLVISGEDGDYTVEGNPPVTFRAGPGSIVMFQVDGEFAKFHHIGFDIPVTVPSMSSVILGSNVTQSRIHIHSCKISAVNSNTSGQFFLGGTNLNTDIDSVSVSISGSNTSAFYLAYGATNLSGRVYNAKGNAEHFILVKSDADITSLRVVACEVSCSGAGSLISAPIGSNISNSSIVGNKLSCVANTAITSAVPIELSSCLNVNVESNVITSTGYDIVLYLDSSYTTKIVNNSVFNISNTNSVKNLAYFAGGSHSDLYVAGNTLNLNVQPANIAGNAGSSVILFGVGSPLFDVRVVGNSLSTSTLCDASLITVDSVGASRLRISDNTGLGGSTFCKMLSGSTTASRSGVSIGGNTWKGSTAPVTSTTVIPTTGGVHVQLSASSDPEDFTIVGNSFTNFPLATNMAGVRVTFQNTASVVNKTLNINGNTIEPNVHVTGAAYSIASTFEGIAILDSTATVGNVVATITSNTISNVTTSRSCFGVRTSGVASVSVASNDISKLRTDGTVVVDGVMGIVVLGPIDVEVGYSSGIKICSNTVGQLYNVSLNTMTGEGCSGIRIISVAGSALVSGNMLTKVVCTAPQGLAYGIRFTDTAEGQAVGNKINETGSGIRFTSLLPGLTWGSKCYIKDNSISNCADYQVFASANTSAVGTLLCHVCDNSIEYSVDNSFSAPARSTAAAIYIKDFLTTKCNGNEVYRVGSGGSHSKAFYIDNITESVSFSGNTLRNSAFPTATLDATNYTHCGAFFYHCNNISIASNTLFWNFSSPTSSAFFTAEVILDTCVGVSVASNIFVGGLSGGVLGICLVSLFTGQTSHLFGSGNICRGHTPLYVATSGGSLDTATSEFQITGKSNLSSI